MLRSQVLRALFCGDAQPEAVRTKSVNNAVLAILSSERLEAAFGSGATNKLTSLVMLVFL